MNWTKPKPHAPSAEYYIDGESGWRICKSYPGPVYTLSHRGRFVMHGSLEECKRRADEDRNAN